jgi:hypothetical protein
VLQRHQFDSVASLAQVADGDFWLVPLSARFRRFARVAFFIDQFERFDAVTRFAQTGVGLRFGFVPRARGETRASRAYARRRIRIRRRRHHRCHRWCRWRLNRRRRRRRPRGGGHGVLNSNFLRRRGSRRGFQIGLFSRLVVTFLFSQWTLLNRSFYGGTQRIVVLVVRFWVWNDLLLLRRRRHHSLRLYRDGHDDVSR